jgi:hypothetical protein
VIGEESYVGERVQDLGSRDPAIDERSEVLPCHAVLVPGLILIAVPTELALYRFRAWVGVFAELLEVLEERFEGVSDGAGRVELAAIDI